MSKEVLERLLAQGNDNALFRFGLGKSCLDAGYTGKDVEYLWQCCSA